MGNVRRLLLLAPTALRVGFALLAAAFAAVVFARSAHAQVGNAWHIPAREVATLGTMRDPVLAIGAGTLVTITSGNQFAGTGGNPGNQLQAGSSLFFKNANASAWTPAPMTYVTTIGNDKYFSATIPALAFEPGDVVRYYLRIAYSDHVTTYLYGNDDQSFVTDTESVAQSGAYSYSVEWPLEPSGPSLSIASAGFEGRVFTDSGHLMMAGPDLDGKELALSVPFASPRIKLAGSWFSFGKVVSSVRGESELTVRHDIGGATVEARLLFSGDGVLRYEVIDWGGLVPTETAVLAASPSDEHFYGFGEKFNALDQAGRFVRTLTSDYAGNKGDHAYKVAPWFVSTRGFGFHLDSSAESTFDLRATGPDRVVVTNVFPTMRFNVVFGPDLRDVLRRYTAYTGRPPLPPAFAFAPWMSSDHWRDGGEIRYVVTRLRELAIPGSVFVFDSPWEIAYNDFEWNMTQFGAAGVYEGKTWDGFGSAGEMLGFLRSNGFKVVLWMTPFVNTVSNDEGVPGQNLGQASNYDEAAQAGYFVRASPNGPPLVVPWWKGSGSPVDFTNAGARAWLSAKLAQLVDEGDGVIGGFKTDDGEGDFVPLTAAYSDGRTGVEMRNAFNVDYHKTVWGVLKQDGILFARSGFTGTHAFPGCWAGDNEPNFGVENGLPSVIVAGQSAAMSGYSIWSHDIGGYQDTNLSSTPENLFMRWTQFGAFSPIMQLHRQVKLGKQYPWSFGDEALANYQAYSRLHTRLFPYIYTYAKESAETGLPIIRPLVLSNQGDPNTFGVEHAYLFGEHLIVAPMITNDATSRVVYLPEGVYYDFFSGERYEGGQNVTWSNDDQSVFPVFAREGAIVPMLIGDVQTLLDRTYVGNDGVKTGDDGLDFYIVPRDGASFTVHDGTSLRVHVNPGVTTLTLSSGPRPVRMRVLAGEPDSVLRDGLALKRVETASALEGVEAGYAFVDGFVHVKFEQARSGETVVALGPGAATGSGPVSSAQSTGGIDENLGPAEEDGCGCRLERRGSAGALGVAALAVLGLACRRRGRRG